MIPSFVLLLLACGPKAPPAPAAAAAPPVEVEAPPPPPPPAPLQAVESEGMTFSWRVQGGELLGTMSAPGTGWVRVGFNVVRAQHHANMILGWVDAQGPHIEDRYATDPPYIEPDTQLGGRSDVRLIGGREEGGRTTIEFAIPLDSGDKYDLALEAGQTVYFILAYGPSDDLKSVAVVRTAVQAEL